MKNVDDNFSNLIKHFLNYFSADVFSKLIAFLLLPVLTYLLTPEDFGTLAVFNSLTILLLTCLSLNAYTSIGRYYFEKNSDLSSFLSSVLVLVLGITTIMYGVVAFFSGEIAEYFKIPKQLVYCILPIVILLSIRSIYSQVCRAKEASRTLGRVSIYYSMVSALLTIVMILYVLGSTYMSVVMANIIVQAIFVIFILISMGKYLRLSGVKTKHIKYALAYGIPLIPYTLSSELLTSFDVLMINKYLNSHDAGIYSFAYRISSFMMIFIIALNSAWTPKYMRYMNEKDYQKHDNFSLKLMKSTLVAAAFLICYGDILATAISPDAYHEGGKIISVVVLGYVFYMTFVIYNKHTTYVKKLIYQSLVAILGGVANVMLNLLLIPKYGYVAAAYTTLFSFVLMAFLSWIINYSVIKLSSVPMKNMLLVIAPVVVLVAVKQLLFEYKLNNANTAIISTILMVLFVSALVKGKLSTIKEYIS